MRSFQNTNDIVGRSRCLFYDFFEVFTETVMSHTAVNFDAERRNVCEANRVVWLSENGFAQVTPNFCRVDIECSAKLDVLHAITAKIEVHQTRDEPALLVFR